MNWNVNPFSGSNVCALGLVLLLSPRREGEEKDLEAEIIIPLSPEIIPFTVKFYVARYEYTS